jgi:hypothetical protein
LGRPDLFVLSVENEMTQRLFASCIAFLFLGSTSAIAQSYQQPTTNSDVIRMVHEGMSEEAIISAIQVSETNFDTSSKALANLKTHKVSEKIIDAMIDRQGYRAYAAPAVEAPPNGTVSLYGQAGWSFGLPGTRALVNYTDPQGNYYFVESPQKTWLAAPSFGVAYTIKRAIVPFGELAFYETGSASASAGAASVNVRSSTLSGNFGLRFVACGSRWCGYLRVGGGVIRQKLRPTYIRPGLPPDEPGVNSRVGNVLFGGGLQYYVGSHWGTFLSVDGLALTAQLTNEGQLFSRFGLGVFYQTKSSMR